MNKHWLLALPLVFLITGCVEERYRYPCQDPHNWENQFCKKPFCSANGTCPEDLRHYEKEATRPDLKTKEVISNNKGVCK
jgi:hypothetical protein